LTLIALIGSVFSPYYARARRRGQADPEQHVALNVALYGKTGKRWSMTERDAGALDRAATHLRIGPSAMHWEGDCLVIDIDEVTVPWPSRLRGQVRIRPEYCSANSYALDAEARHRWQPITPRSRIEVAMQNPALSWQGDAYFDSNWGSEPLEDRFVRWDWSRAMLPDQRCAILYHAQLRNQPRRSLGICFDATGAVSTFEPPPDRALPSTSIWRIERASQCDPDSTARVNKTLEDTPFYARSIIETKLLGKEVLAMHESLSLDRFRAPWVHLLLPFRMPRRSS
jgi:carotenoid 1,2-hydratase